MRPAHALLSPIFSAVTGYGPADVAPPFSRPCRALLLGCRRLAGAGERVKARAFLERVRRFRRPLARSGDDLLPFLAVSAASLFVPNLGRVKGVSTVVARDGTKRGGEEIETASTSAWSQALRSLGICKVCALHCTCTSGSGKKVARTNLRETACTTSRNRQRETGASAFLHIYVLRPFNTRAPPTSNRCRYCAKTTICHRTHGQKTMRTFNTNIPCTHKLTLAVR